MANATTDATFTKDVIQSKEAVLVDFWANWCGPCRMVGPIIDQVSKKTEGKAKVFKLNVDENPKISAKYEIRSIPTVLVFKNGQVINQMVGVQPEEAYLQALAA